MSGYNPTTGERTKPVLWKDGKSIEPHIGASSKEDNLRFEISEAEKKLERLSERADSRAYETQVIPEDKHPDNPDKLGVPGRDEAARRFTEDDDLGRAARTWESRDDAEGEEAPVEDPDLPGGVKVDRAESMGATAAPKSNKEKEEGQAKKTTPAPAK
jgi:hypothetical protein